MPTLFIDEHLYMEEPMNITPETTLTKFAQYLFPNNQIKQRTLYKTTVHMCFDYSQVTDKAPSVIREICRYALSTVSRSERSYWDYNPKEEIISGRLAFNREKLLAFAERCTLGDIMRCCEEWLEIQHKDAGWQRYGRRSLSDCGPERIRKALAKYFGRDTCYVFEPRENHVSRLGRFLPGELLEIDALHLATLSDKQLLIMRLPDRLFFERGGSWKSKLQVCYEYASEFPDKVAARLSVGDLVQRQISDIEGKGALKTYCLLKELGFDKSAGLFMKEASALFDEHVKRFQKEDGHSPTRALAAAKTAAKRNWI